MITKADAGYLGQTWTRFCRDCVAFRPPNSCGRVAGDIDPRGTCQHFELRIPDKRRP